MKFVFATEILKIETLRMRRRFARVLLRVGFFRIIKIELEKRGPDDNNDRMELQRMWKMVIVTFIFLFFLCPLYFAIKLNSDISKVACKPGQSITKELTISLIVCINKLESCVNKNCLTFDITYLH